LAINAPDLKCFCDAFNAVQSIRPANVVVRSSLSLAIFMLPPQFANAKNRFHFTDAETAFFMSADQHRCADGQTAMRILLITGGATSSTRDSAASFLSVMVSINRSIKALLRFACSALTGFMLPPDLYGLRSVVRQLLAVAGLLCR
jgi:hypothetical protein